MPTELGGSRLDVPITFNSLFEMRTSTKAQTRVMEDSTFNSLFEMREVARRALPVGGAALSILYLRCNRYRR